MVCQRCHLYQHSSQMMPSGQGNPDVYIVFDKPEDEDIRFNEIGHGTRSRYLSNYLTSVGITDYRMWSIVRCIPYRTDYTGEVEVVYGKPIRTPSPEEVEACIDYVKMDIYKNNPKVIVSVGSSVLQYLLNVTDSISQARGTIYELTIRDKTFKVVPTYSPTYLLKNQNPENISEFLQDLSKAKQISDGVYIDVTLRNKVEYAMTYHEFKDFYTRELSNEDMLAYDIETNAESVYSEKFDIIGFSLAKRGSGIYVCLESLDYVMPEDDRQKCRDLLVAILKKTPKIVVHNSLYERPATYYNLGYEMDFDKVEDTLVMVKLMLGGKTGAGLKPNAKKIGYPDWDKDLDNYISTFMEMRKRIGLARYRWIMDAIRGGMSFIEAFETNPEEIEKYPEIKDFVDKIIDLVKPFYNDDEIKFIIKKFTEKFVYSIDVGIPGVIPYSWIPSKLICSYGATDSLATFDLYDHYMKRFDDESTDEVDLHKGYYFAMMEHFAGYELMMSGMYWDDKAAQTDYDNYMDICLRTLKYLDRDPIIQEYIVDNNLWSYLPEVIYNDYNEYFWDTYDRRVIEAKDGQYKMEYKVSDTRTRTKHIKHLSEDIEIPDSLMKDFRKRVKDKINEVIDNADTFYDIQSYFNPASTSIRDITNKVLVKSDVKTGFFINKVNDLILQHEDYDINRYSEREQILLDDIMNYLKLGNEDLEKKSEEYEKLKKQISGLRRLDSKDFQSILGDYNNLVYEAIDDFAQVDIYNNLVVGPIDPENPDTWTHEFKWIVDFRLFKKSQKIISSYLEGSVGRQSLYSVDKDKLQTGDDVVLRGKNYFEYPLDTKRQAHLDDNHVWLEQTSFGVGTAETGRWRCLTGDTKISVLGEGEVCIKDLMGRTSFYVYSYDMYRNTQTVGHGVGCRVTGENVPIVRVTFENGDYFDCTPEHKLLNENLEFVEAKDCKIGDLILSRYSHAVIKSIEDRGIADKVYDITVENYHNFALECAGIFVHNSAYHTIPLGSSIKKLYVSRFRGGTILQPDFSANELRCIASAANEKNMLEAFAQGLDIHKSNASKVFKVPMDEITPFQRRWAKTLCLHGDTKIRLLSGESKSIKELFDNQRFSKEYVYTYSLEDEKMIPNPILMVSQNREEITYVEVVLDNGATVKCTNDHPFLTTDGIYKKAEELVSGDSLMSQYFKISDNEPHLGTGYELFFEDGEWKATHRRVRDVFDLDQFNPDIYGTVIHHNDYNKRNNSPENLKLIDYREHFRLHRKNDYYIAKTVINKYLDNINTRLQELVIEYCILQYRHPNKILGFLEKLSSDDLNSINKYIKDPSLIKLVHSNLDKGYHNSVSDHYIYNARHIKNWTEERRSNQSKRASDQEIYKLGNRSKYIYYIKRLMDNGIEVNKENYNKYRPEAFYQLYENLDDPDRMILEAKMLPYIGGEIHELDTSRESKYGKAAMDWLWSSQDKSAIEARESHRKAHVKLMSDMNSDPDINVIRQKSKMAKIVNDMFFAGFDKDRIIDLGYYSAVRELSAINGKSYNGYPISNRSLDKYFNGDYEKLFEYAENYNHKVVEVRVIKESSPVKFYDLTIDNIHNFLIDLGDNSGIYVKNSFSTLYGASEYSVAQTYFNGDIERARQQLKDFYDAFPDLTKWINEKHKEVLQTHKVSVLTHRFLNIDFDPNDKSSVAHAMRRSQNFPIQSFTWSTPIFGLDGKSHMIGELAENHKDLWIVAYDVDQHKMIPVKGIQAQCTGVTDTWYEIILDNGKSVKVTPEHKMMLRSGDYRRADELSVGDSLMPLYTDRTTNLVDHGRLKFVDGELIQNWSHDNVYGNYPRTHVHHINFDTEDNRPENLIRLSNSVHTKYHRDFYEYCNGRDNLDYILGNIREEVERVYKKEFVDEKVKHVKDYIESLTDSEKLELSKKSLSYRNKVRSEEFPEWDNNQKKSARSEVHKRLEETGNVLGMDKGEYSKKLSENWSKSHDYRVQRLKEGHNKPESIKAHSDASIKRESDPIYNFNRLKKILGFMQESNLSWRTPEDWDKSVVQYPIKSNRRKSSTIENKIGWDRFIELSEEYLSTYNHKIVDIKVIHLDKPEKKYDLHVPKYHNFALSCGVFTHNSASSTMAAVILCDIAMYYKKNNLKSKTICFIHDSLESDVAPYELFKVIDYEHEILAHGGQDYFGVSCKADVSMGYSMGHECELKELQILNDEKTEGIIVLEGFKDEIYDTINNWKTAYNIVEILEEEYEKSYTPLSQTFITKKAYDPTILSHREKGKAKIHIRYYNENREIDPITDDLDVNNAWDNAPLIQYLE